LGKKTALAHSAYAAAAIQEKSGRLPKYSPNTERDATKKELASRGAAAREAASSLVSSPSQSLPKLKHALSSKYGIAFLKNSEILSFIPAQNEGVRRQLLKSPTRTLSGISPIAIMPPPAPCGGHCIYCPKGEGAPQSYTGFEPTTMRAIQNNFSARGQVLSRLKQYSSQGHLADKCHLIVMGGTFLHGFGPRRRDAFMKEAYEALNGKKAASLSAAIDANESAPRRAIGVTFETRPDYSGEKEADEMLAMGGTQVELGVQALSDRVYKIVHRGHRLSDVARATRVLKDSGFKVCYHMMPGLFSTPKQDVSYFRRLFSSPSFQPDMLKIYPALVLRGTGLHSLWKEGKYSPYNTEQAAEVIARATRFIPPYVRIPRIQRDIPSPLVEAGVKNSNLRQIVDRLLSERGEKCRCIRCREIGSAQRKGDAAGRLRLGLQRLDYSASGGKEIFLSFEDKEKDLLAAFLRLRLPGKPHRRELGGASVVRELHVYGQEAAIGEHATSAQKLQHTGLGKKLLAEAEEITRAECALSKIAVISGPGARGYYRKQGYSSDGPYMAKKI
jgi:elongator complex protein 3